MSDRSGIRAVLKPGSRIEIGNTLLVFRGSVAEIPTDVRRSLFASNDVLQAWIQHRESLLLALKGL